jgi:prepilin-type processing-associated H-X9-DG protein
MDWRNHSAFVMILPQLDQGPVFNLYNFNARSDWDGPTNTPLCAQANPAVFHCPSDGKPVTQGLNGQVPGPGNNYVLCEGPNVGFNGDGASMPITAQNGMFNMQKTVSVADVTDGTSNVIMGSELIVAGSGGVYDKVALMRYGVALPGGWPNPTTFLTLAQMNGWGVACQSGALGGGNSAYIGNMWHVGLHGSSMFNTLATPNWIYPNCTAHCGGCAYDGAAVIPARSKHTGGVHCLMADGAVRFVADNVNFATWQNLGAINDGNTVTNY